MTDSAAVFDAGRLSAARNSIHSQLGKAIIGQKEIIDQLLICLFARGHALIVGVPGLAKTLMVSSLSRALDLEFQRIQFTPDLMPSDVTGFEIMEEDPATGRRHMRFVQGPVFANMLLADEINRTPPKTQSALLQAMQEYHVTAAGQTRALPRPFFVLATQNPIEQEGTYPLPEAQLDRFLMQINIGYPSQDEEELIAVQPDAGARDMSKVLSAAEVLSLQEMTRLVPVTESVVEAAVRLARLSRPEDGAPDFVKKYVSWGAGPRASQSLVLAGKAAALLDGRCAVSEQDIAACAPAVMRHRVITNFQAEADGVTPDAIISRLCGEVF